MQPILKSRKVEDGAMQLFLRGNCGRSVPSKAFSGNPARQDQDGAAASAGPYERISISKDSQR